MVEIGDMGTTSTASMSVKDCIFSGSYDATTPDAKPIDLRNYGTVSNCILEGFSDPLTSRSGDPVSLGSVASYNFDQFSITTTPGTIMAIGDSRWTLNGSSTSISTPDAENAVKSVEYYDILGKQISTDAKGLVIEKVIYEDGSVSTAKVFK
jgi:hypothetical protein